MIELNNHFLILQLFKYFTKLKSNFLYFVKKHFLLL
jgi:hypothetical protein